MKILSLDTSAATCSVAIYHAEQIYQKMVNSPKQHAQQILPLIQELLQELQLALANIQALAYVNSPGSFTGLRIGAGIVQGLALARNLPIIPVSGLQVMAYAALKLHGDFEEALVVMDASMSEVYWARCHRSQFSEVEFVDKQAPLSAIPVPSSSVLIVTQAALLASVQAHFGSQQVYQEIAFPTAQSVLELVLETNRVGFAMTDIAKTVPKYLSTFGVAHRPS